MTARKAKSTPCEVGYGKPPLHTRFRKGQSGNPGGRPPRNPAQRMKALMLQEAYRGVVIKEDGRMVPVTAIQAILRSQVELAANGNVQAQRAILAAVRQLEWENELDAEERDVEESDAEPAPSAERAPGSAVMDAAAAAQSARAICPPESP